jgi:cation diffusion facilitator family transporter
LALLPPRPSPALWSQAAANLSDVGVQVFLLVGVLTSGRRPDNSHPLGYGRERFFWSLLGALGVLAGGCVVAFEEAFRAGAHPPVVHSFAIGYAVLGVTLVLDGIALGYAARPVRRQAAARRRSLVDWLWRTTNPAATTEVVANTIGVAGSVLAIVALVVTQMTHDPSANVVASGLIGVVLIAAAIALVQTNRALLTGRGVSRRMLEQMRLVLAAEPGILDVPDLFGVVVGPASIVVGGELTFADEMNVPEVERILSDAGTTLRGRWPSIDYVYLTPVANPRHRGV